MGLVSHHHGKGFSAGIMFIAVLNGFVALLSIALGAVNAIFSWMSFKSSSNPEYGHFKVSSLTPRYASLFSKAPAKAQPKEGTVKFEDEGESFF